MLKPLVVAILKAFGSVLAISIFMLGIRVIEAAIDCPLLWDVGVSVICFCCLTYCFYKDSKEKRNADRS